MNLSQKRFRTKCAALAMLTLVLSGAMITRAFAAPLRVDLRRHQTAIRDQGDRSTCITFAAVAAMEAAYKRAGYGELDLSEQFLNHIGKTFWLHDDWEKILKKGEDASEGQVGAFGGGGGVEWLVQLANGFKTLDEAYMPYRTTDFSKVDHPHLRFPWNHRFWNKQRRMSDFNLNPQFLPKAALHAHQYYSIHRIRILDDSTSASEIESALASGHEVVWDFDVADTTAPIWRPCDGCGKGSHAMLLVGYDRTASDPRRHYFIAKNSWGKDDASVAQGSGGFTYISYDYLQYGYRAAYIVAVNSPQRWPELGNVGRWNMNFDGWRGSLDVYHLPGLSEAVWKFRNGPTVQDRRIGSYYDTSGRATKVNGKVQGNYLGFCLDVDRPNLRWDQLSGRRFEYYRLLSNDLGEMFAGFHRDPDGRMYGGYLRKKGYLKAQSRTPRPFRPESFMNVNWEVRFEAKRGIFRLTRQDNSFLKSSEQAKFHGLRGVFRSERASRALDVFARVSKDEPKLVEIIIPGLMGQPDRRRGFLRVRHLNHEDGIMTGVAHTRNGSKAGAIVIRKTEFTPSQNGQVSDRRTTVMRRAITSRRSSSK